MKNECRMNINSIQSSGWYPSNLVRPVRINGSVFKREKIENKNWDEEYLEDKKVTMLKAEMKQISNNPITKLSAEHDDMSYTRRLVPLYRSYLSKYQY